MFLLVPAYMGSPGSKAVKRLCVCLCVPFNLCVCVPVGHDAQNGMCIQIWLTAVPSITSDAWVSAENMLQMSSLCLSSCEC